MKSLLVGMLAASSVISCGSGTTSTVYECSVTCTINGSAMTTAPFEETEASRMDALDTCESKVQAQLMTICGSASATASCICDPTQPQ